MAGADSIWVQACAFDTGLRVASTRAGLGTDDDASFDLEVPSVILQRDGGGDATRFTDAPLLFADVLAADRVTGEAICRQVDDWFRWTLPRSWGGLSLRMRRCVSGFSEVGDSSTSGVIHYSATYDCVTH